MSTLLLCYILRTFTITMTETAAKLDYLTWSRVRSEELTPRTPDISRNGQAVTIRFEEFMVDVVPGFHRKGGGYLIPSSITQSRISTDPKKHVDIVSDANTAHNDDFIPLVKMMKGRNKKKEDIFIR